MADEHSSLRQVSAHAGQDGTVAHRSAQEAAELVARALATPHGPVRDSAAGAPLSSSPAPVPPLAVTVPDAEPLGQLRDLLFRYDRRRVDELFQRVDGLAEADRSRLNSLAQDQVLLASRLDLLFNAVGTEERLKSAIARVLDQALREAEVAKHRELADAMSPLVLKTIDAQIDQSKPKLVAMLYPEIGRMVSQYVQSAMKDLIEGINRKLNGQSALPPAAGGVSDGEAALVAANRLELMELFLIRRGTGELVQHWARPGEASVRDDSVMMRNYLSAIVDFAEAAFTSGKTQIRTADIGSDRIYFRTSADLVLAARCRGLAPADIESRFDEGFLRVIESLNSTADSRGSGQPDVVLSPALPTLAERIDRDIAAAIPVIEGGGSRPVAPARYGRLYALAAAVLLPLALWIGWTTYSSVQTSRVRQTISAALKSFPELRGYPIASSVNRGGSGYRIEGLVPDLGTRDRLADRLRRDLGTTPGEIALTVLPDRPRGDVRGELERYLGQTAIFFAEGTEYLDPGLAQRILTDLVQRLTRAEQDLGTPVLLRVIGYTDERGGAQSAQNLELSRARAERVAEHLRQSGANAQRLVVVGRTQGFDITSQTGTGNANRRVEFELGFVGEPRNP